MLHIPTVASLLVTVPNPPSNKKLWEENLTILFPYRKQLISAFLQCLEIEGFIDKIKTADFNLLQDLVQKLTDLRVQYNFAMPSLTAWRSALQLSNEETFKIADLLNYLQSNSWQEILTLNHIPEFYKLWAFFQKKDYQNAVIKAKELLINAPQDEVVLYILGNSSFHLGEYLWAVEFLESSLLFGMTEAEDIRFLIEQSRQKLEEQAQQLPLSYWQTWAEKLIVTREWKVLEKLTDLVEKQVLNFPKADLFYYRGLCCEHDFKKSILFFTQAIDSNPKHYFYTQRGEVYLKLKKKKEAASDFRIAIQLNEEDDQARQLLESIDKK
jgi:tetratricopeptide (TPR) repeat protein